MARCDGKNLKISCTRKSWVVLPPNALLTRSFFHLIQAFAPRPLVSAKSITALAACRTNAKKEKIKRNRENMRKFRTGGKRGISRRKALKKQQSAQMRQEENEVCLLVYRDYVSVCLFLTWFCLNLCTVYCKVLPDYSGARSWWRLSCFVWVVYSAVIGLKCENILVREIVVKKLYFCVSCENRSFCS